MRPAHQSEQEWIGTVDRRAGLLSFRGAPLSPVQADHQHDAARNVGILRGPQGPVVLTTPFQRRFACLISIMPMLGQ